MTDSARDVRRPRLAIISPVYNEAAAIPLFFARIQPVLEELSARYAVRLAFVNNSSTDETLDALQRLRAEDGRVQVITLSANVGYQRSLETGLRTLEADLYVMIDVDCEDPPEMIVDFLDAHENGYDVVYGERIDRHEPRPLKAARRRFYRTMRALADDQVLLDMAEFALLTHEVRDAIIADRSSFPFIRASIGRAGYRRLALPYKRERRIAGETHYSVVGLIRFAVAGILSSSTWLLRITVYVLPLWLTALVAVTAAAVFTDSRWPLPVLLLLSASYIGCTTSFTAIYVGRAYKDGLGRPNAFIDSRLTFLDDELRVPHAGPSGGATPQ
jgi:glycosyltransferase involved in cell wall biosynthesis